jgi:hypothetical protein
MGDGLVARRRAEITERLLLATVPGSATQRLLVTAVVAKQQISSREQTELRIVKEAAVRFADADDLKAQAPTLYGIYAGLPAAVQATVEFEPDSSGQKRERQRALDAALEEQNRKEQTLAARKEPTAGRKP